MAALGSAQIIDGATPLKAGWRRLPMPLQMPPELLFSTGPTTPLHDVAVQEFLGYARRISSPAGRQGTFEEFKRAFCRVSGEPYHSSSSEGWAESDLVVAAGKAADNAPGFIQAFVEACEALQIRGAVVPDHARINHLLAQLHVPFRIEDGQLLASSGFVAPPDAPKDVASTASRAFLEAAGLVRNGQASSAIDRIHTALHAYFLELCGGAGIEAGADPTTGQLFKLLRDQRAALQPTGPRHEDVTRILRSFAMVVDAMSPIRNKASLAHANPLLEEPEALVVIHAAYTIFRYVQDSLARQAS
jgi:hypothetical protein